jgi:hypothetical protein
MSGKNILWRLLDGHPKVISNCMHSNIGYFVLSDVCKKWFLRSKSSIEKKTLAFVPQCQIAYNSDEVSSIGIGDFFYAFYTFTSYRTFYSWSKGNSMFVNMKEGENERFPFIFDINSFEKKLENELFVSNKVFTEEEVLDIIYSSYIYSLGNKTFYEKLLEHDQYFVDTLPNGINPIRMVAEKVLGSKIIVMKRDLESLLYANAARIMSYKGDVQVNDTFMRVLYNQKQFEEKMKIFYNDLTKIKISQKNVLVVDFNNLILNTELIMKNIAKFIGIDYDPILALPSINGEIISNEKYQIIGKINDDPYNFLSKKEIDLLKYFLFGFNKKYSILKNVSILLLAIKWRHLTSIKRLISVLLEAVIPERIFLRLKKIY